MCPWRRFAHRLSALAAVAALTGCAAKFGPEHDRAYEVSVAWISDRPAVAWYGGRLAHDAIFLGFADSRGHPSGPAMRLTDASRDAFEPSLQELDGDALVAWYEQEPAAPPAAASQVAWLGRFSDSGRRLWLKRLSAEDSSGRIPVVRVSGGIIHAAWLEQHGTSLPQLRVATLDAKGEWLQAPRDATAAGRNTWNLNAAVGADGAFHVLFDADSGTRASELHWLQARGDQVHDQRVSRDDGRDSVYPDISLDGWHFAAAWFDSRDGNSEVYLRCGQLDASGAPAANLLDDGAAVRVTHTPADSTGAYVSWHAGHVELAWTEGEGANRELWRQRFDRNCRPTRKAQRVNGQGTAAGIASLAASASGLALAWNGQRADCVARGNSSGCRPTSVVLLEVWPKPKAKP
jgi:hypothetical protein